MKKNTFLNILNIVDKHKRVDKVKSLILESDIFEFESAREAKFTDYNRPVFRIKFIDDKNDIDTKTDCIYENIIRPYVDFIQSEIETNITNNSGRYENGDLLIDGFNKDEIIQLVGMISGMFGINYSEEDTNSVTIELMV